MKKAHLILSRQKSYADSSRAYKVFLNGQEVGVVENGMKSIFEIEPGEHLIHLKIDWCKTPQQKFNVKIDEKVNFECGSNLKGFKLLMTLFYLFKPSKWIFLDRV